MRGNQGGGGAARKFTSRSHSSLLQRSLPSAKLLIPLERPAVSERTIRRVERRDVRVVEGARLESVCRGNSTVGSNPTLSAIRLRRRASAGGLRRDGSLTR